jgi:two-component system chemotaxis sensor kinase CheA
VNALLQQFLAEGRDLLQRMAEILLLMEQQRDPALMAELFRTVHTLKGNSGLFSFPEMTQVLHAAEDVMDAVRHERLEVSSCLIDQLLQSCDFVSELFADIEQTGGIASYHGTPAIQLSGTLRQLLEAPEAVSEAATSAHNRTHHTTECSPRPAWLEPAWLDPAWLAQRGPLSLTSMAVEEPTTAADELYWVCYEPDAQCFFNGEDPFYSMRQLSGLRFITVKSRQLSLESPALLSAPNTLLLDLDVYDCQLQFVALVATTDTALAQHFRYVRAQVQWVLQRDVEPSSVGASMQHRDITMPDPQVLAALSPLQLAIMTAQYHILRHVQREILAPSSMVDAPLVNAPSADAPKTDAPHVEPSRAELHSGQPHVSPSQAAAAWQDARAQAALISVQACLYDSPLASVAAQRIAEVTSQQRLDPMLDWLSAIQTQYDMPAEHWQQQAMAALPMPDPKALLGQGEPASLVTSADHRGDVSLQNASVNTPLPTQDSFDIKRRSEDQAGHTLLKVEQRKIDRLVELIGEMVVAKNALPYIARKTEQGASLLDIGRDIKQSYAVIHRIADEMQDAIMQVRMMPVSFVLQRFPRLVRDLARKLNKEVQLQLSGEETEADKNIIEALSDPLMHIVRNSLDHGLESPSERLAAGKTAVGHLKIHAKQDADRVLIRIEDDGRGIDPELVKRKAWEKGLISDEERARLGDEEAIQLIFRAGFSTAEQISDLSGRGVGMDVVRNALLAVGGSVQLQSKRGQGTQLLLSLPLSMAVSHVMMIETQQQLFGVPMDAVIETVRLRPEQLFRVKQQHAVVLREKIVPLFALNQLLAIDAPAKTNADGEFAALIIELEGHPVGLLVDEFKGVIDVILKPLPGELAQLRCYSGSTLLGDGSVLMVLNPRGLW